MYVYIIECSDGSYYIGVTNNVDRRFNGHNQGINKTCYTYKRRPLKLAYYELFQTPNDAIAFEKRIKKWTRAKKKALIEGDWDRLIELSKSKDPETHG